METAYPLLHINSLPESKWANPQAEEVRTDLLKMELAEIMLNFLATRF